MSAASDDNMLPWELDVDVGAGPEEAPPQESEPPGADEPCYTHDVGPDCASTTTPRLGYSDSVKLTTELFIAFNQGSTALGDMRDALKWARFTLREIEAGVLEDWETG